MPKGYFNWTRSKTTMPLFALVRVKFFESPAVNATKPPLFFGEPPESPTSFALESERHKLALQVPATPAGPGGPMGPRIPGEP